MKNFRSILCLVAIFYLASCDNESSVSPQATATDLIEKIETSYKQGGVKIEGFSDGEKIETSISDLGLEKIQANINIEHNGKKTSLAYPAEPCLAVGSAGLQRLKELRRNDQRIFGSTDCEGRFLIRNLLGGDVNFVPVDNNVTVDFHNFKRFEVKEHNMQDRDSFIKQLSAYAGQTQNMSNLDFFTRQLAFGLAVPDIAVRKITKLLYVPNLLKSNYCYLLVPPYNYLIFQYSLPFLVLYNHF